MWPASSVPKRQVLVASCRSDERLSAAPFSWVTPKMRSRRSHRRYTRHRRGPFCHAIDVSARDRDAVFPFVGKERRREPPVFLSILVGERFKPSYTFQRSSRREWTMSTSSTRSCPTSASHRSPLTGSNRSARGCGTVGPNFRPARPRRGTDVGGDCVKQIAFGWSASNAQQFSARIEVLG